MICIYLNIYIYINIYLSIYVYTYIPCCKWPKVYQEENSSFFRCQGSERLEFTVPDGVAKGSSPGKGGPLATDRFLRPFLPKKRDFFLTFWGGAVAQKQGFQKTNQIEDILCLKGPSKRSLLRLFGILVCCIISADAI